ncbi:MAG TPA: CRISPR-associated helicase Cas3' [Cyanobacteria bacterium UBA8803]|nr:CRISPR-associated helicase Cas3' [Cyanobacteria bacterium UBA9273]HBL62914.1 CRISPR-associated helicase Cas3' [Cyanobacteria bacterium UBA8803]
MFKTLLAKSLPQQEASQTQARGAAKYTGHISCVIQAADTLVEQLGLVILKQLGLDSVDITYFARTVRLGAYLHDWGKANQHFQEMVYLNSEDEKIAQHKAKLQKRWRSHSGMQMLRHEIISGILALQVPSLRKWLEQCPNANLTIAVWAAIGHHLKVGLGKDGKPSGCIAEIPDGTGDELKIYTHHSDFQAVLRMGSKLLDLTDELPELPPEIWSKVELKQALQLLLNEFIEFETQVDWEQKKFIAAVKATVMAADLAGSALPLTGENLQDWIEQVLNLVLSEEELQKLIDQRLDQKPLRQFQQQIANTSHRVTLVKAGCGTGKTVGAYAWAKKWAKGRKLFFSYPTTGTASQGYIDYADGTNIEATLMHSRADLDREILFSGDSDDAEGIDARLTAFQAWRKKLIICTVDSVLGLIQNNRRPLYAWPAIAQSAFVFDEVHAYDDRLFGALLQFLKTFSGAPILLMSASFTPGQLEAIGQVMTELGEPIDEEPIRGSQELEELGRYQIQSISEFSDDLSEVLIPVLEALRNQQKVLWVTNSVQSCIDIYRFAQAKIAECLPESAIQPLIYHSRYRYKDRLNKHKAIIDAFSANAPTLAITTQVCEMSLDISADLLISAMAPAAALIQRLGRLNRRMTKEEEGTRLAIVYPWHNKDKQPYEKEELNTGKQLVEQLAGKTKISQQDLSEVAERLGMSIPQQVKSAWLEGNWCTYPNLLRQGGYTIAVLLEEDLGAIAEAKEQRRDKSYMKAAQAFSVPIRIIPGFQNWQRKRFYPVAPADEIIYSEETGAEPCSK